VGAAWPAGFKRMSKQLNALDLQRRHYVPGGLAECTLARLRAGNEASAHEEHRGRSDMRIASGTGASNSRAEATSRARSATTTWSRAMVRELYVMYA
jgi:hypothetical protein